MPILKWEAANLFPIGSEFLHRAADLTLVPSAAISRDLLAARVTAGKISCPFLAQSLLILCFPQILFDAFGMHAHQLFFLANKIRLWNKGVDSESFHPRFLSHEMRLRLR